MQIQIASFYAKYFSWWLWLAKNRRVLCGERQCFRRIICGNTVLMPTNFIKSDRTK